MDVHQALRTRRSIRAFKPDVVDDGLLRQVLDGAREAPSWSNTQPYLVALATGARLAAVRAEMLAAIDSGAPAPEHGFPADYPPPLKERRQATGYGLYGALGIDKRDLEGRLAHFRRNYAFFDAPAVMFLYVHEALGAWAVLDCGAFLQSILLQATELGLGTCAQATAGAFPAVVARHFAVPERYRLMCGVSLGYAADEPVNRYRPAHASVDELVIAGR
ncbi:MAG: nitroreductase [Deltaproteobacteria bacterium]|nr:nitroreductase [Deltaproteobacteria bacterium]